MTKGSTTPWITCRNEASLLRTLKTGVMAQARIANSLLPLQELKAGAWALLGIRQPELAGA